MALAAGTGYLVKLIYYVSIGTLKMVDLIPVPSLMALTSLMGIGIMHFPNLIETTRYDPLGPTYTSQTLYRRRSMTP